MAESGGLIQFQVHPALVSEAAAICTVLRRSIIKLCGADHGNDPAILNAWLANKSPDIVAQWISSNPDGFLVAVSGTTICGVGAISATGEIKLNYVSPDARFSGISKTLVHTLEDHASARGCTRVTLTSSRTAYRFYRTLGYEENGPAFGLFGCWSYPLSKELTRR